MSVSSLIRGGLGSNPSDLVRLGLGSGALATAAGPIITMGLKYTPSSIIRLGLGGAASVAPVLSAAYGTPTGSTTATVGCTTDTASGTLYAVATASATQPSVAQIKAGQDHTGAAAPWAGNGTVSSTSPSFSATGLTAATNYYVHLVQTVSAVDSNVDSSSVWTTDNPGTGGGTVYETTGALVAGSAVIAGTAVHTALVTHTTTGALIAGSAAIAGTAVHTTPGVHATTGAFSAGVAAIAGTAVHLTLHTTTGALSAGAATIAGTAVHPPTHHTTGALVAAAAAIAGAADHTSTTHGTSGNLVAGGAVIAGTAVHTSNETILDAKFMGRNVKFRPLKKQKKQVEPPLPPDITNMPDAVPLARGLPLDVLEEALAVPPAPETPPAAAAPLPAPAPAATPVPVPVQPPPSVEEVVAKALEDLSASFSAALAAGLASQNAMLTRAVEALRIENEFLRGDLAAKYQELIDVQKARDLKERNQQRARQIADQLLGGSDE